MKIKVGRFRIEEGEEVALRKRPTAVDPLYASEEDYKTALAAHVESLAQLQEAFYACDRHALLVVIQALDAAGKDSAIEHIMSGVNPQGCEVTSFKQPSAIELQHDFLWRAAVALPERGRIGIFNRSYYEEVLVVRVHPAFLNAQGFDVAGDPGERFWRDRYRSICDFEAHLTRSGTRIVKIYLHLSKEEQRKRFLARIDEPAKNWKFNPGDLAERARWDDYRKAYEDCLSATSTKAAPWWCVPADDKKNARLIISQIVLDALTDLHPAYPEATPERRVELAGLRDQLAREGQGGGPSNGGKTAKAKKENG